MKIIWDKKIKTEEEITLEKYINDTMSILEILLEIYIDKDLFTISFTPSPLKGNFYTYELKYHKHDKKYLIIVWKGVRMGDGLPVLHGYLDNYEISNKGGSIL